MPTPFAAFALSDDLQETTARICSALLKSGRSKAIIKTRLNNQDYIVILSEHSNKKTINKTKLGSFIS